MYMYLQHKNLSITYRIRQNFRGGKLSQLCTKHTIHWKTFAVHQAHAIMYCTQQMMQGENFRDWLINRENREGFPPRKFCRIRYMNHLANNSWLTSIHHHNMYVSAVLTCGGVDIEP